MMWLQVPQSRMHLPVSSMHILAQLGWMQPHICFSAAYASSYTSARQAGWLQVPEVRIQLPDSFLHILAQLGTGIWHDPQLVTHLVRLLHPMLAWAISRLNSADPAEAAAAQASKAQVPPYADAEIHAALAQHAHLHGDRTVTASVLRSRRGSTTCMRCPTSFTHTRAQSQWFPELCIKPMHPMLQLNPKP